MITVEVRNVSSKLKNKWMPAVGTWCKTHKAELIGFGTLLGATIFGACIGLQFGKQKKETEVQSGTPIDITSDYDPGRNLIMKFFDEETGELYREEGIPCTEDYAKDYYDCI